MIAKIKWVVDRQGLGCFTGWLIGNVLGLLLLSLFIVYSLEVAENLKINMGVNRLDQLPHAGGFFLVRSISLTLGGWWGSRVGDLTWVSQRGVLGHSHHLEGRHLSLPKPMKSHLVDNELCRFLGVCKALVIPFAFASFKSYFQISYLIGLGQIQASSLRQFRLNAPQPVLCLG